MAASNKHDTLILGGGLTGLSAAYHTGGVIYEKEAVCGGTCRSPVVDGYTFDLGIHVLHTKNESILQLFKDLGVTLVEQPRDAWIYSYGALTRYPFQANTFGLPVPVVKECLAGFVEAYCNLKQADLEMTCGNYREWIYTAFGKGIAEHFMIPYSEKFWTVSPEKISTDWLDTRIPLPDLGEVIEGALTDQRKGFGPNILFKYPSRKGIAGLAEAFAETGIDIRTGKKAVKIDPEAQQVLFEDGELCDYRTLISTIPLPELFTLFCAPEELMDAVARLKHNSILCVNLAVNRAELNEKHWIYYPEDDYPFFRISFLKNFAPYLTPEGKSSITAEIAYSAQKPINRATIEDEVIDGLIRAGILNSEEEIEFVDLQDLKYGYVIFDDERPGALKTIKAFLDSIGIITAGRYGSWEYQWMDDAVLDGMRAAREGQQFKQAAGAR